MPYLRHWVCFSNINLNKIKKYENVFTIYDCYNKGATDCSTRDTWLNQFDLYIKSLSSPEIKRNFLTSNIYSSAKACSSILALAYAVSIANSTSPLPIQFECEEQMISHFNLCLTNRFLRISLSKKNASKPKGQKYYFRNTGKI